jgi:hypothetical protein
MGSPKGYGQLKFRKEAIAEFKKCREPDESWSDTLTKIAKTFQEKQNRKRPDCSDPGIQKPVIENA